VEAILQIVGAVAILAAYVAAQFRLLQQEHPVYLLLNSLGAGILAVIAYHERQWGFLLLEGVWTLISLRGVLRWLMSRYGDHRHDISHERAHDPARSC
jgi:hypothetical protein